MRPFLAGLVPVLSVADHQAAWAARWKPAAASAPKLMAGEIAGKQLEDWSRSLG